jgi:hypothetical protein
MTNSGRIAIFLTAGSLVFPLGLILMYIFSIFSVNIFTAWITGWGVVFIGFVYELLLVKKGLAKSDKSFIRNTLGAMSVRLFSTVVMVFICLVFLELNQNNFIFSILIFYFFYLIIEIIYLNFRSY